MPGAESVAKGWKVHRSLWAPFGCTALFSQNDAHKYTSIVVLVNWPRLAHICFHRRAAEGAEIFRPCSPALRSGSFILGIVTHLDIPRALPLMMMAMGAALALVGGLLTLPGALRHRS